jgi:HEAT repeat protein
MIRPSKLISVALRRCLTFPACVVELAVLGVFISGSILILTTSSAALFLAKEGSEEMPVFYILLAAVSIPLASGISAVLSRWLTLQVSAAVCLASALLGIVLWGMAVAELPGAAHAAYIAAYSLEILYDTLFWLLASEYLTTLDMKRHAAQLAMAFGAGGVGGGLLASLLSQYIATQTLLLVASFLFLLSFLQCLRIGRRLSRLGEGEDEEEEGGALEAIMALAGTVRSFPLVGAICGGILLMSALFCLQDYLAMTIYAEAYADEDKLAGFLAVVYSAQQAAELVILALFGRIVLERGGPMLRNMIFPVTTLLSLGGLLVCWGLPAAVIMHMNANAVSNAIFEPVKTLNYAAIPYRMLGQVRMLVEGVIYPAGIALSGIGLLWLQSRAEPRTTLLVAFGLSALFVLVCGAVGSGFLPSLLRSLRQRTVAPAGGAGHMGVGISTAIGRISRADILALENHPDPQVRRHAADLINRPDSWPGGGPGGGADGEKRTSPVMLLPGRCMRIVARGLEHRLAEARQAAAEELSRFGDAAIGEAAPRLLSSRPEVAHAAILALGGIGSRRARRVLLDHLRPLYRQAHHNQHGLAAVRGFGTSAELVEVLAAALAASNRRIIWRVLMVKAALGSRRDIRLLHSLAHSSEQRVRADAIEALFSMPTGRFIRPVLSLLDAGSNDNLPDLSANEAAGAVMKAAASDRWTRLLAARLLEIEPLAGEIGGEFSPGTVAATVGEQAMLDLILFLKSVPLFQALTLEEIAGLVERGDTAKLAAGQTVFEAGESVRYFAVIRSGTVELRIQGVAVDTITHGASFGENAFLEDASHTMSGVAVTDLIILRFHRAVIADLVAEHPLVLPRVLAEWQQRLARLYARLAEETEGRQPRQRLQLVHDEEFRAQEPGVDEPSRSPDECA